MSLRLRHEVTGIGLCFNLLIICVVGILVYLEQNGGLINPPGFFCIILLCVCCHFDGYRTAEQEETYKGEDK